MFYATQKEVTLKLNLMIEFEGRSIRLFYPREKDLQVVLAEDLIKKLDFVPDYDQDLSQTNWKFHPIIEVSLA